MKPRINEDQTQDVVLMVRTFEKAKGWRLYIELAKWIFTGLFMGTSDAVPGYSGGTTLALLGFFKRLVLIAKSVFVPEPGLTRLKALLFMLPFAAGWMGGVFGFAKLTEFLVEHGCGLELIFFFSFFIAFAIPVFLKSEKPHLRNRDKQVKRRWALFILGLLIVIGVALWTFFGTEGAPWSKDVKKEDVNKFDYSSNWWKLILVAYFAGLVSIIPGGSGAIIQLLSGMYEDIHWKIMAHPISNIGGLATFAISTFAGMVTAVFAFSWLLKKHETDLAAFSFGMLIASIGAVYLVPERGVWQELHSWKHIVGITAAATLAVGAGITINLVVKQKHKNN